MSLYCILLVICCCSFENTDTPVFTGDPRYKKAADYIKNSKKCRSYIKEHLGRQSLKYRVNEKLIKSFSFAFLSDLKALNINWKTLKRTDSLSCDTLILPELRLLSVNQNARYWIDFSQVIDNRLYAHLTSDDHIRESPNGLVFYGARKMVQFLFIFDEDGAIKHAFYGSPITEPF